MNLTFHGTFGLNFKEIRALVETVLKESGADNFRISELTGIGIGQEAGKGKLQPIIKWAEFGGILESKAGKVRKLELSEEGRILYNADPYFNSPITSWFFHYHLSKPDICFEISEQILNSLTDKLSIKKLKDINSLTNNKLSREILSSNLKNLTWYKIDKDFIEKLRNKIEDKKLKDLEIWIKKQMTWFIINDKTIDELSKITDNEKLKAMESLKNKTFLRFELIKELKNLSFNEQEIKMIFNYAEQIEVREEVIFQKKLVDYLKSWERVKITTETRDKLSDKIDAKKIELITHLIDKELSKETLKKSLEKLTFAKYEIDIILKNTNKLKFDKDEIQLVLKHLQKVIFTNEDIEIIMNNAKSTIGCEKNAWYYFIHKFLPSHYEFTRNDLIEGLKNEFPETKIDSINPGVLLGSYLKESSMKYINLIQEIKKNHYRKTVSNIATPFIVGYILAKIWEREHPESVTIPLDAIRDQNHLINTMNISEEESRKYLDALKNYGVIDLMRSVKPFQIVKQWKTPGEILKRAYEEL